MDITIRIDDEQIEVITAYVQLVTTNSKLITAVTLTPSQIKDEIELIVKERFEYMRESIG